MSANRFLKGNGKMEPKYVRTGARPKWAYIKFGSNINPFFPGETFNYGTVKPGSIFAKWKPDDEDGESDSEFILDETEVAVQKITEEFKNLSIREDKRDLNNSPDDLLQEILCDPKLDKLGKIIVKRKLSAEDILKFNERDWQRHGVMDTNKRKLIIKFILETKHSEILQVHEE